MLSSLVAYIYADDIKCALEKMHIGDKIVRFVGVGKGEPLTVKDISFYLAQSFHVYVEAEKICFDKNTNRWHIHLNNHTTAFVPLKNQTVIKMYLFQTALPIQQIFHTKSGINQTTSKLKPPKVSNLLGASKSNLCRIIYLYSPTITYLKSSLSTYSDRLLFFDGYCKI